VNIGDRSTKEFYKQFATQKDKINQLANTNGDLISDNHYSFY